MIQYPHTLKNKVYYLKKRGHGDTTIFLLGYQSYTCPLSGPFYWQSPCSGCNSRIDLVVVLEYTFFELCSNTKQISYVHKIQKERCKPPCCSSNQGHTAFLLNMRCSKLPRSFFCSCLSPVHLRNLFVVGLACCSNVFIPLESTYCLFL